MCQDVALATVTRHTYLQIIVPQCVRLQLCTSGNLPWQQLTGYGVTQVEISTEVIIINLYYGNAKKNITLFSIGVP